MPRFPVHVALLSVVLAACGVADPEPDRPPSNARELAEKCLSAWDGNHDGLERQVKAVLNDPSSMEVHGTYFNENDSLSDGEIRIRMDYSAANAFGGMVRGNALADMNMTCGITIVQYE